MSAEIHIHQYNKYVMNQKPDPFDENSFRIMSVMGFLIENIFVEFGGHIVKNRTNCALLPAINIPNCDGYLNELDIRDIFI